MAVLTALEPTAETLRSRDDYSGWMESVSAAAPFVESLMDLIPGKAALKPGAGAGEAAGAGAAQRRAVVDKKAARGLWRKLEFYALFVRDVCVPLRLAPSELLKSKRFISAGGCRHEAACSRSIPT